MIERTSFFLETPPPSLITVGARSRSLSPSPLSADEIGMEMTVLPRARFSPCPAGLLAEPSLAPSLFQPLLGEGRDQLLPLSFNVARLSFIFPRLRSASHLYILILLRFFFFLSSAFRQAHSPVRSRDSNTTFLPPFAPFSPPPLFRERRWSKRRVLRSFFSFRRALRSPPLFRNRFFPLFRSAGAAASIAFPPFLFSTTGC